MDIGRLFQMATSSVVKALNYCVSFVLAALLFTACSTDPNKRKLNYLKDAEKYVAAGKYQEAVIQFRNALEIDPRFATAHYELGCAYMALKIPDAAFRELNEAVTLDPSNYDAQVRVAALLVGRGKLDQAQLFAQKVLAAEPGNARAHAILAEKHTLAGDYSKAIEEFKRIVELEPQRVENYSALGAAYRAADQLPAAEDVYKNAVRANPKSAEAQVALSQFYFSTGKLAEAETAMRAACDLDSRSVQTRIILGRIYLAMGRTADAENIYAKLKTIAPDDPAAYQSLGLFYSSTNQKDKAAAEFLALLKRYPKDNSIRANLLETLLDLNRIQDAAPLAQKLLGANPNDARGLSAQGRIQLAQAQYDQAIATFQKAIKSAPDLAFSHYFLGVAQQATGFPDLAKASFTRALELQPQMSAAAAALASLAARNGNPDEALRLAENARRTNPGSPATSLASAQAFLAKGNLRQASAVLQDALARDPASLPALATLLNLEVREGRAAESVRRLAGLIQQDPQNASLHFLQGLAYFSLKDMGRAETSVRQALKLDPYTPGAYTLLGNIALAKGAPDEAKSHFRTAIAAHPRNLLNYMALVTQYEREGNWEEAKRLCEKAHEIDTNSPLVAAELAFLYLEHGGDVNTAVSLAQIAKQKLPDSPITTDALGWAYYKLGSMDSALAQLKESSRKVPDNPTYHYHLGMAYLAAHQSDLALRSLQAALRTDPQFLYAANARAALEQISKGVH
jgi:tetratricopeptide (TPR) repeat protein